MTPVSPENADIAGFFVQHWERFIAGLLVIVGFIYKTGSEHQKYNALQSKVVELENECENRMCALAAMNSNIHLIMGKLGIQPVEGHIHHRSRDE